MHVVAAFPGCGKSTMTKQNPQIGDSDSSQFPKENGAFPKNYLDHIEAREEKGLPTFVSSHDVVRQGLVARFIPFFLVYPALECKDEYIQRYIDRAGTGGLNSDNELPFAKLMSENWEKWIQECMDQRGCMHIVLKPGQFLADVIQLNHGVFITKDSPSWSEK